MRDFLNETKPKEITYKIQECIRIGSRQKHPLMKGKGIKITKKV